MRKFHERLCQLCHGTIIRFEIGPLIQVRTFSFFLTVVCQKWYLSPDHIISQEDHRKQLWLTFHGTFHPREISRLNSRVKCCLDVPYHTYTVCNRKSGYERMCQYLTTYMYFMYIDYDYSHILYNVVARNPNSIDYIDTTQNVNVAAGSIWRPQPQYVYQSEEILQPAFDAVWPESVFPLVEALNPRSN